MYGSAGSVTRYRPVDVGFPLTELLFKASTNLSWLHQGCLPGGPRPRRDHGVHPRLEGPPSEFDSLPLVEMDGDRRIHAETNQPRSPKVICLSPTRSWNLSHHHTPGSYVAGDPEIWCRLPTAICDRPKDSGLHPPRFHRNIGLTRQVY